MTLDEAIASDVGQEVIQEMATKHNTDTATIVHYVSTMPAATQAFNDRFVVLECMRIFKFR